MTNDRVLNRFTRLSHRTNDVRWVQTQSARMHVATNTLAGITNYFSVSFAIPLDQGWARSFFPWENGALLTCFLKSLIIDDEQQHRPWRDKMTIWPGLITACVSTNKLHFRLRYLYIAPIIYSDLFCRGWEFVRTITAPRVSSSATVGSTFVVTSDLSTNQFDWNLFKYLSN